MGLVLTLLLVRLSKGTQQSVPEEVDHRIVAAHVSVMNEVQFLFTSEPCEPPQARFLDMILFVKKNMRVERSGAHDLLHNE